MLLERTLAILRARWFLMLSVLALTVTIGVVGTLLMPKRYTATTTLVAEFRSTDPVVGQVIPPQMVPGYLATQADVIRSAAVAMKVVNALGLARDPAARERFVRDTGGKGSFEHWLANDLLEDVKVRPARESSVLMVAYTHRDPARAAAVANAIAQAYIDINLDLRVQPARLNAAWFDERIRAMRTDLETAQAKVSAYQASRGITASEERIDNETARLDQLNAQLSQMQAQTYDAETRRRLARDFIDRGVSPDAVPEVLQSPLVVQLKGELSRQEAKLKELGATFGENHPQRIAALAELESLRGRLRDEMRKVLDGVEHAATTARDREASMRAAVAVQKDRVLAMKRIRDELAVLQREADGAQRAFDLGKQRLAQSDLESRMTQNNIGILSPAVEPTRPASPVMALNAALATLTGLLLAALAAFGSEALDRRVRATGDVGDAVGAPLLMVLPRARVPRGGGKPSRGGGKPSRGPALPSAPLEAA